MYGHVNTVLPLAHAARRAGHEVVLATGPDMVSYVGRCGLQSWPVGPTHAEARATSGLSVEYFVDSAEKRAVDLVPLAVEWRPDVVVHEDTELAGMIAAAATGAQHVVHGLGLMQPLRIWQALEPAVAQLAERWGCLDAVQTAREAAYVDVCPPSLQPAGERVWPRTHPVRPSPGAPVLGQRLPEAIATLPHDRTVHLTLGTVFHEASAVLAAALAGLRELPVNVVVAAGPGTDPARFGPQPDHVLIEAYLPHALLLPSCQLVVSQGGAGIMFGALAHGLPQLILPQGADQFMNADAARRTGAALTLGPEDVSAGTVAAAATRLLSDPRFTDAAVAVQAEIAAMPQPEETLTTLLEERS